MVARDRLCLFAAFTLLVMLTGCGGLSQDDMAQYAIRRPKDDESSQPPIPTEENIQPQSTASDVPTATDQNVVAPNQPNATPNPTVRGGKPETQSPVNDQTAMQLSDTISPPATPFDSVERRRRTLANITRISKALESYREKNGRYPIQAIHNQAGQALLSWRVELLPLLGYQELYDRFEKTEPWNSVNNQPLLQEIPSVFQSPERFDDKTNYLFPVGSSCAFFGNRPKVPRRWEDGMTNVAVLLEVDDQFAVPWTQPDDFVVDLQQPKTGLGNLREDGFFMAWGGGQVARIAATSSGSDIKAMFTVDGGEPFNSGAISLIATAEFQLATKSSQTTRTIAENQIATASPANRTLATSNTSHASASVNPLDSLVHRVRFAFESQQESAAVKLAYIAFLADQLSAKTEYRWVPGLRRPAAFVRYGIAIDYSGPDHGEFTNLNDSQKGWQAKKPIFTKLAGELSSRLIELLERTVPIGPEMLIHSEQKSRTIRRTNPINNVISPGVECLGAGDMGTMFQVAADRSVDVLLMFKVQDREVSRGSTINKYVTVQCYDVLNRRRLYESPSISYTRRDGNRSDPLYKDPIEKAVSSIGALLADKLAPQSIPAALETKHAVARTKQLASATSPNKLVAAAEVKLYHHMELLSMEQTLEAYTQLFGTEIGLTMLAGDSSQREKVLDIDDFRPRIEFPDPKQRHATDDTDDDD